MEENAGGFLLGATISGYIQFKFPGCFYPFNTAQEIMGDFSLTVGA